MRPRPARLRKALEALTILAGALTLTIDVRPARTQTPFDFYRERVAMTAAGARCRLFDAETASALAAGVAQARTASLRAGYTPAALDQGAASARGETARMACDSPKLVTAAAGVRQSYRAYATLDRMVFPGLVEAWRADRIMPSQSAAWRLAQDSTAGGDKVVFGMAGQKGVEALTLSVASADGASPYSARLLVRDADRLPEPILPVSRTAPLSARAPMRAAARVILPDARAVADPALRPRGSSGAVAFRFPASARQALEQLDPREAVSVEILYNSGRGEVVRTAFLEVGDFEAGIAFLNSQAR